MNAPPPQAPDALLLITTHCAYCPTVLQSLAELVKQGRIGRLEVVNIMARADIAARYGVRTVPWIRIAEFELEGMHSRAELEQWLERAGTPQGLADYYTELLAQGKLARAIAVARRYPDHLAALLSLADHADTEFTVRIGVSAVMEDFAGTEVLQRQLPTLLELSRHTSPVVRADAAHYLALTESPAALESLQTLSKDPEPSVRDVAQDSLEELRERLGD